jgi:hypothetical protein
MSVTLKNSSEENISNGNLLPKLPESAAPAQNLGSMHGHSIKEIRNAALAGASLLGMQVFTIDPFFRPENGGSLDFSLVGFFGATIGITTMLIYKEMQRQSLTLRKYKKLNITTAGIVSSAILSSFLVLAVSVSERHKASNVECFTRAAVTTLAMAPTAMISIASSLKKRKS